MLVARERIGVAASRFLEGLAALVVAGLIARGFELARGMASSEQWLHDGALALGLEAIGIARGLPLLFLLSLAVLPIRGDRARTMALGILWSGLLVAQIVLMQYFLTVRQPLGSDLFGYSLHEIHQTVRGISAPNLIAWLHFAIPLSALWVTLLLLARREPRSRPALAVATLTVGIFALLAAPSQSHLGDRLKADGVVLHKGAYFVESSLAYFLARESPSAENTRAGFAPVIEGFAPLDPQYPFLHREQTPDSLGPLLRETATPPNLFIIIVEGLGRSFSGPQAEHGSFTPFLDELAASSLYFENFLANQGRTFGVLPTVLGSLPFAEKGFTDLKVMPTHVTLLSVLKRQGYHTRFYAGFDLRFDHMREFLEHQGVDRIVDIYNYGPEYSLSESGWGYADGELVTRTLAGETRDAPEPFVVVVKTSTMHPFYKFPKMEDYLPRLEHRLDQLGVREELRASYREFSDIYRSILYTDDSLRRLVEGLKRTPAWNNALLIVLGDHSLAELPLASPIGRYHVPLIIHSDLLKQSARIKAVSSQMDLTPSLLAYLGHCCGLRSPGAVAWLGSGLDLGGQFGNRHEIAFKLTKTKLADFVQGRLYLSRGRLFELGDGMVADPIEDSVAQARLEQALARFARANRQFADSGKLMPDSRNTDWIAYREEDRVPPAAAPWADASTGAVATPVVSDVRVVTPAHPGALSVNVDFSNRAATRSVDFVPLVVMLSAGGSELTETYGKLMSLPPGQTATVTFAVNSDLPKGQYLMAVIPSDPLTGKAVGRGRHGVTVSLQ